MWELRRNMSELGKYFVTCPEGGETVIYELSACGKRVLDMGSLGIAEMPDAAQNAQGAAVEGLTPITMSGHAPRVPRIYRYSE